MAFDTTYYTTGYMLKDRSLNTYNPAHWDATITATPVTSGVNINVSITNRTANNMFAPNIILDIGWGASGTLWPTAMSLAAPSFKRWAMGAQYVDSTRPDQYGDNYFPTSGVDAGLNIPALCWDNSTGCIGFGTNYPYTAQYRNVITSSGRYGLWLQHSYTPPTISSSYVPPQDWYSSGENKTFDIWLRAGSGTVTDANLALPLALQQPFASWYQSTVGNYRPPRVAGRIHGILMASFANQSTNRGYSSRNGVRVDTATGWAHLLNNHLSVANLKASGYTGTMLWALNGVDLVDNNNNYLPVVWSDLPSGLKSDVPNLQQWQVDNNFDIYVWVGQAYYKSASGFKVTNPLVKVTPPYSWISGSLTPQWDLSTAVKYTGVLDGFEKYIDANIANGPLVYCKGVGLDFAPNHPSFPAITGVYGKLRREHPDKIIFTEGLSDCVTQGLLASTYTAINSAPYAFKNQFDMIRCPLQEMLTSGYQNFILYSEPSPPSVMSSGEAAGHCIITFSSLTVPTGMNTTNYPSSGIVPQNDVFSSRGTPRFLR